MTPDRFRQIALSFPDAEEGKHMGHADFRVGGKIFASLGPDEDWGMVKVSPEEQAALMGADPESYRPASGAWGHGGATIVTLRTARVAEVKRALGEAWKLTAPKGLVRAFGGGDPGGDRQGAARAESVSGGRGKRRGSSNSSPRKREPR